MNYFKFFILELVILMFSQVSFALVSKAKVTELALHRIDRLVTLNKIDSSFLYRLSKLETSILENQSPIYYQVIATQNANSTGNPLKLILQFDMEGKALSFQVHPNGLLGADQEWPDKDSVTLAENCLHYVLEGVADDKIKLFDQGLLSIQLDSSIQNSEKLAMGTMISSLSTEKLVVYLKLDGTFLKAVYLNR